MRRLLLLARRIAAADFFGLPRSMTAGLTLPSRMRSCIVMVIRVHLGADGSGTCLVAAVRLSADSLACYMMSCMSDVPVSFATQSRMAISVVCRMQLIFPKALLPMSRLRHALVPVFSMSFKHGGRRLLEPRSHLCHSMYADPSLLPPDIRRLRRRVFQELRFCLLWRLMRQLPSFPVLGRNPGCQIILALRKVFRLGSAIRQSFQK